MYIGPQFNSTNEELCARQKNILKNKDTNERKMKEPENIFKQKTF